MLCYFGNRLKDRERKRKKENEREREKGRGKERTGAVKIYEIIGSECNFRKIIELL